MCLWVARLRPLFGYCNLSGMQLSRTSASGFLRWTRRAGHRGFRAQLEALSDLLLASFFATAGFPAHLDRLQDVIRVYHVPAADDQGLLEPLTQALASIRCSRPGLRGAMSHRRPRQPAISRPHSPSVTHSPE